MATEFPNSHKDPLYASLDAKTEAKLGLPVGLLSSIRLNGEKSNNDQVSSAGATSPYQFIPSTRQAIIKKYGIDPLLSPEMASEAAGLLLKEGIDRNKGDASQAVGEYIGGTDRANWGKQTNAYINRVMVGQQRSKVDALGSGFAEFMRANPAVPAARPTAATPGETPAPKSDPLAAGFGEWLQSEQAKTAHPSIPGSEEYDARPPPTPATMGEQIVGAGEAALSVGTGMTGGMIGALGGTAKGIYDALSSQEPGMTGIQQMSRGAEQGAAALTYQPRTDAGQSQAQAVGDVLAGTVPLMGMAPQLASLGRVAETMAPTARAAPQMAAAAVPPGVARVAEAVKAIPGRAAEMFGKSAPEASGPRQMAAGDQVVWRNADTDMPVTFKKVEPEAGPDGRMYARVEAQGKESFVPLDEIIAPGRPGSSTPRTMSSSGAAGTDMATIRRMQADELPVPMQLTKGQAERTFEQQRFEQETAKNPELGKPLRDNFADQNQAVLRNFDAWVDMTGAAAPDLRAAGLAVDKALVAKAARDKAEIRVAYKDAEKAGEMAAPVSLQTLVDHLNESAPDAATAPLLTTARQWATKLGIAKEEGGQLVPVTSTPGNTLMNTRPTTGVTLKTAETYRQAINRATDFEPTNIRQATIIKKLIDEATDGQGGDLYRAARRKRELYANQYENRAVISKMLNTKRGTQDRQVAYEDMFDHAILRGSLDDVRTVRKVLQTGGDEGKQAWKEMQGQTVNYIRDQATRNVATDIRGNKIVSAAGLDKAIKSLDADGKLDFIFGKKGAEQLRALNDLAKYIYTAPPGSVNTSNTASVILAAMDMAISGAGGMPLPITTGIRMVVNNVKDRRVRLRVNAALQAPGPRKKPTLH